MEYIGVSCSLLHQLFKHISHKPSLNNIELHSVIFAFATTPLTLPISCWYCCCLSNQSLTEGVSSLSLRLSCFITLTPLTFTIVMEYGRLSRYCALHNEHSNRAVCS
ncbi:uncharacterized protein [Euwallacea similis]|uniref:uncharacterized protein n=1 Tax=Euwallacea similis TaxID=1736056 RepID=UPI00344CB0FD